MKTFFLLGVIFLFFSVQLHAQEDQPAIPQALLLEIQSLRQDLSSVTTQVTSLSDGLKETNSSLEKSLEELKRVAEKVDIMGSTDGIDAIKEHMKRLSDEFSGVKSDVSELSKNISVLDMRFSVNTFSGTASFLRDEQNLYKTDDLKLAEPQSLSLFQNILSPRDLKVEVTFFIDDEKYNKSIESEFPALNKPVSLKIHVPAHLLQKFPTTIALAWGESTHTKATFTLALPFDNIVGFIEKAELNLQNLASRGTNGKIDLVLRHKTSKNKAQLSLSFSGVVDQNPLLMGVQY